jgi:hypothetical protein
MVSIDLMLEATDNRAAPINRLQAVPSQTPG